MFEPIEACITKHGCNDQLLMYIDTRSIFSSNKSKHKSTKSEKTSEKQLQYSKKIMLAPAIYASWLYTHHCTVSQVKWGYDHQACSLMLRMGNPELNMVAGEPRTKHGYYGY